MNILERLRRILSIKYKLILLTSGVVFSSVLILSTVAYMQFRAVILEKTLDVCRNLSANISNFATEELLLNDIFEQTRAAVGRLNENRAAGMLHTYVVYRDGKIVAHTNPGAVGAFVHKADLELYRGIKTLGHFDLEIQGKRVLRFASPIFITSFDNKTIRLGTGVFEFDRDEIYRPIDNMRLSILAVSLVLLMGTLIVTYWMARRFSRPIETLVEASSRIAEGELGVRVNIRTGGEIGKLAGVFNDMSQNLLVAEKHRRENEEIKIHQAAITRELEIARGIQMAVLPANGELGPYSFQGYMKTADEVGGDYYDCLRVKSDNKTYYWFFVGDVSGHGLQAGLIMLMAQTAIHTAMTLAPGLKPDEAFNAVNQVLYSNIERLQEKKYMTATFFRGDQNGRFVMAGLHQDILIYRAASRKVESLGSDGMWLGILEDISGDTNNIKFKLQAGDTMVMYTDGITETINPARELFGDDRLLDLLERYGDLPLPQIQNNLLDDLEGHQNGAEQRDDITFALIRKN